MEVIIEEFVERLNSFCTIHSLFRQGDFSFSIQCEGKNFEIESRKGIYRWEISEIKAKKNVLKGTKQELISILCGDIYLREALQIYKGKIAYTGSFRNILFLESVFSLSKFQSKI